MSIPSRVPSFAGFSSPFPGDWTRWPSLFGYSPPLSLRSPFILPTRPPALRWGPMGTAASRPGPLVSSPLFLPWVRRLVHRARRSSWRSSSRRRRWRWRWNRCRWRQVHRRKGQPPPRRMIAHNSWSCRTWGAGDWGDGPTRVSSAGAWRLTRITIPSLTFSLQPSHLRIPLTFSPSHHRLLLRFPLEVLPHLHLPLLPPGSHLHPASSLSAPVPVFSLPAHTSIPGLPWSQPPAPSTQVPWSCIPEHPACCLPHPFRHLPPPGPGTRDAAVPPPCLPTPPGTSEAAARPGASPPRCLLTFPPYRLPSAPLRPEAALQGGLLLGPRPPPELRSLVCGWAELEGGAGARRVLISPSLDWS